MTHAKSDNLRKAKAAKNDEFYTHIDDIEAEITHHNDYVRQFQGKTVLCPCDDPEWSNFFICFRNHFQKLGIKKLITTHYNKDGSPSYKLEWNGETLNTDMVNLIKTPLKGNGDFRSEEIREIMREYGEELIVVTNPPFSEYRTFIAQLEEFHCKYVVIGNKNSIAYKEVFPLLKDGKMFVGYNAGKGTMHFATTHTDTGIGPVTNSVPSYWFTNLDLDKSHNPIPLNKNYKGNEDKYPRYDNYDAIECGKVSDIPKDYFPCWYECPHAAECEYAKTEGKVDNALCENACNGEIGVPVTYLSNHTPDTMDIIGSSSELAKDIRDCIPEGDTYDKGGPTFYLPTKESSQFVNVERERERNLKTASQTTLSQNCHQTQVPTDASVTELSESPSRSCRHIVVNNSSLLDWEQEIRQSKSELPRTTEEEPTSLLQKTENQPAHTTEFSSCVKCNGMIAVPLTYMSGHCSEQFKIIGHAHGDDGVALGLQPYPRELKKINKGLRDGDLYRIVDGKPIIPYNRIIIQRIKPKESEVT